MLDDGSESQEFFKGDKFVVMLRDANPVDVFEKRNAELGAGRCQVGQVRPQMVCQAQEGA